VAGGQNRSTAVDILIGDVFDRLRELPSNSVDCVVTSPPYWGLRDYGVAGQIGLEPTLGEHLEVMVRVFREVRRVLKNQGTLWLNYGDCYAAAPNGKSAEAYKADGSDDRTFRDKPFSTVGPIYDPNWRSQETMAKRAARKSNGDAQRAGAGVPHTGKIVSGGTLKPKDLCMVPNRLAIALQDDGWYVRSEIIWHKPNPMPESVYDRPTTAHEKLWLLTKSEDYFYNHEAVREPVTGSTKSGNKDRKLRENHGGFSGRNSGQGYGVPWEGETKNARNVWTIAPKPFREAHFATFPPELARRCIAAGAPETVCGYCGAAEGCGPICETFPRVPGTVLDPFGGAGTVGLVAEQLSRNSILVELNPAYAEIARRRIFGDAVAEVA
jgi:DNA modification methylase